MAYHITLLKDKEIALVNDHGKVLRGPYRVSDHNRFIVTILNHEREYEYREIIANLPTVMTVRATRMR